MIEADRYTPADEELIPTGQIARVAGTPFDFTKPTPIGERISEIPPGYDVTYVLDSGGGALALAARVRDPKSGRTMTILTTEPSIQLYTGNFLDGSIEGLGGAYTKYAGLCLETQHFPDSANKPDWPSIILRPHEHYSHVTVHRFAV